MTAVLAGVPSSGMRTAVGPGSGLISHLPPCCQHAHGAMGSWPSVLSMLCEEQVSTPHWQVAQWITKGQGKLSTCTQQIEPHATSILEASG